MIMAWDKHDYERKRLAYNAAQEEKRKHERIAKALETLRECGVLGADENLEAIKTEHAQFRDALITLAKERDELDARLSGNALHQENQVLRQQSRDRDWREAWRDVARESGMLPRAIDHAWKHFGPKADTDEPDRAAMQAAIDGMRSEHGYFWPTPSNAECGMRNAESNAESTAHTHSLARFVYHQDGQWRSNGSSS